MNNWDCRARPPVAVFAVADNCNVNGPALDVGGNWDQNPNYGPFLLNSNPASNADSNIGARLLVFIYSGTAFPHRLVKILPSGHGLVGTPNRREVNKEEIL